MLDAKREMLKLALLKENERTVGRKDHPDCGVIWSSESESEFISKLNMCDTCVYLCVRLSHFASTLLNLSMAALSCSATEKTALFLSQFRDLSIFLPGRLPKFSSSLSLWWPSLNGRRAPSVLSITISIF